MAPPPIDIHADISKASTLPADVYHAREYYELQKDGMTGRWDSSLSPAARSLHESVRAVNPDSIK